MAQPDADIPIDIHYNKLLDWLMNRRHCQQQWQSAALVIREKINNAIQDMPPVEEITTLLQGTYINYFHCLRILELLKDTESGSKNIFGRYSSQRMKDWLEIVKLYEKEDVYLAEVAQLLMRNVNYEIPSLKKQVSKCQQAQNDCTRKEGEYLSNSSELKEKFNTSCKQMGIQGKKVKTELMELVKDLPTVYDKLGQSVSELDQATQYYCAFVEFTLGSKKFGEECVPLLKYMKSKGNTTTYEWRTGKTPTRVDATLLDYQIEEDDPADQSHADEIDWGDTDQIDFDISAGGDTIDFGDSTEVSGEAINWGDGAADVQIEVVDNEGITEEGVARGEDALSLLDNTETRNNFVDELLELEAFLSQRLVELRGEGNILSSSQFQSAPKALQVDPNDVKTMLSLVRDILHQLTSPKMQDLVLIRSSPRYVDRISESLKKTLSDAEKMTSLSRLMVTRRQEALDEQKQTEPKLDLIREKTQMLKKQIEGEISKKYQDRRVNIMGEINTI